MRYVLHDDSLLDHLEQPHGSPPPTNLSLRSIHSSKSQYVPTDFNSAPYQPIGCVDLSAYNPLFPLISARSPILPILSTLGAPQIITFPESSAHPFFLTHSISLNRRQRRGIHELLGVEIEFEVGVDEVDEDTEFEREEGVEVEDEECGIPDESADGELV